MTPALLLDTGPFAMLLLGNDGLKRPTVDALRKSGGVFVSAISIYEIVQKSRLGKWADVDALVPEIITSTRESHVEILSVTADISKRAAELEWDNRDPFDRVIVATASVQGLSCVSSDRRFDETGIMRVWH